MYFFNWQLNLTAAIRPRLPNKSASGGMKTANYSTEIVSHNPFAGSAHRGAKSFSTACMGLCVRSERLVFCVLMKPPSRFIRNFSPLCIYESAYTPLAPPHTLSLSLSLSLCNGGGGGTTIESNKYKRQYCRRAPRIRRRCCEIKRAYKRESKLQLTESGGEDV